MSDLDGLLDVMRAAAEAEPWMQHASCARGWMGDTFFPELAMFEASDDEDGPTQWAQFDRARTRALEICQTCPVIHQCADYADRNGEKEGVWGGVDRASLSIRRRTHCANGHPFTEENTLRRSSGSRHGCRTCRNAQRREAYAAERAAGDAA